jgi:hypothetical protein
MQARDSAAKKVSWVLSCVIAGCGHPAPQPLRGQVAEEPVVTPPLPAWHVGCSGEPRTAHKKVTYEFSELPLFPVRRGPRATERSHAGYARTTLQLAELLHREHFAIRGCWKWAAARGAPATKVDLAVTIAPDGTSRGLEVVVHSGARELERCLRDNLAGMSLGDRSPRTTRFTARLELSHADQPPWPRPPSRPMPQRRTAPLRACGPVVDGVPPDVVAEPRPFLVDDRDPAREPRLPSVQIGCTTVRAVPSKARIRDAFLANRGALQACYASARERSRLGPDEPGGTVTVSALFGGGGLAQRVQVGGAGDTAFHECVAAAAREVWLVPPPSDGVIEVNVPFDLRPPRARPGSAEDMLRDDDFDGALAAWSREARTATDKKEACRARVDLVRAWAARAPWLDDERLFAALRDAGRAAAGLPAADGATCIQPIVALAKDLAFGDGRLRYRWATLPRIAAIQPLAPFVPWGKDARWLYGEALLRTPGRRDEGIAVLEALGSNGADSVAAARERGIPLLDHSCF